MENDPEYDLPKMREQALRALRINQLGENLVKVKDAPIKQDNRWRGPRVPPALRRIHTTYGHRKAWGDRASENPEWADAVALARKAQRSAYKIRKRMKRLDEGAKLAELEVRYVAYKAVVSAQLRRANDALALFPAARELKMNADDFV